MMLGAGEIEDAKTEGKATMHSTSLRTRRAGAGKSHLVVPDNSNFTRPLPVLDSHFAHSDNFNL